MKVFHLLIIFVFCFYGCNKAEKMKNKILPERPYEDAKIDNFYWAVDGWDYSVIPLIKPFLLIKLQGSEEWELSTGFNKFDEISISKIDNINVINNYISGHKANEIRDFDNRKINIPEYWFIIDTQKGVKSDSPALIKFNKESDFKAELKNLNLPEEMLTPDALFEQYKTDPVLPWFPEEIKKQLEEVKKSKK